MTYLAWNSPSRQAKKTNILKYLHLGMTWGAESVLYPLNVVIAVTFVPKKSSLLQSEAEISYCICRVRPKKGRGHLRARDHFTEYLPEPNMFLMGPLK